MPKFLDIEPMTRAEQMYNRRRAKFLRELLQNKATVSIRVKKSLYEEAKKMCAETGINTTDYIQTALAQRIFWDIENDEEEKDDKNM